LKKAIGFRPVQSRPKLGLTSLWTTVSGVWPALARIVSLSFVLQLAVLSSPFLMQIAVDTALPAGDIDLLTALGIGFAVLFVVNFASEWNRAVMVTQLNNSVPLQVSVNLFKHMMSLPLLWFQKRHIGDISSRFGSIAQLQQSLSEGFITSSVDGVMSTITLVLMAIYSPILALITCCTLLIYGLLRLAFFKVLKSRNISIIMRNAVEQSAFIETLRGIETIKAFGREGDRHRVWQNKRQASADAAISLARISAAFDAGGNLIINLDKVLFTVLVVMFAIKGEITVGAIFAFSAYKQQFLSTGIRIVQQISNLRMSQVHLSRIGDIALSSPEAASLPELAAERFDLSLRNVSFAYGMDEPIILKDVNVDIAEGETVAILGPSGQGKSTLLKIMMGLYEPSYGVVSVDGLPISRYSRQSFRRLTGSIMQADTVYAGSLAQNVAFFDPDMSMQRVREVLRIACLLDEVEAMPMRFDTLVGDMGSVLSGGQKQRLILARALYGDPKILFMDEGTANLDPDLEMKILSNLSELPMTKVIVAHRPAVLRFSDRILRVEGGRLLPQQPLMTAAAG